MIHELGSDSKKRSFSFIDLFAGIGGFRLALEKLGGQCVFTSEWDQHSQRTYESWYGERPHGDITMIDPSDIPKHDVLAAGFPCQPFSIAGVSKKNSLGRDHGFLDQTQGTLFFSIAKILEVKRPPIAILENVKNLRSHDKGRTFDVIRHTLDGIGYTMFDSVVDGSHWVPQKRQRILMVCFDRRAFGPNPDFRFPPYPKSDKPTLSRILESSVDPKYTISDHLWGYLQSYAEKHRSKGNGFGYGLVGSSDVARTISARYHKDGSEILIDQGNRNPRRLTPTEALRLMGFDEIFDIRKKKIVVSDTQAYRQAGNAVIPAVVEFAAGPAVRLLHELRHQLTQQSKGTRVAEGKQTNRKSTASL